MRYPRLVRPAIFGLGIALLAIVSVGPIAAFAAVSGQPPSCNGVYPDQPSQTGAVSESGKTLQKFLTGITTSGSETTLTYYVTTGLPAGTFDQLRDCVSGSTSGSPHFGVVIKPATTTTCSGATLPGGVVCPSGGSYITASVTIPSSDVSSVCDRAALSGALGTDKTAQNCSRTVVPPVAAIGAVGVAALAGIGFALYQAAAVRRRRENATLAA